MPTTEVEIHAPPTPAMVQVAPATRLGPDAAALDSPAGSSPDLVNKKAEKKPAYIAKAEKALARRSKENMTMREIAWETFEDPGYSSLARWYSIFITFIITFATVCFILESEATLPSGLLYGEPNVALQVFMGVEGASVVIFTLEYVLRFLCCPCEDYGLIRFVFDINNLIDLAAIAPYIITSLMRISNPDLETAGLGFVRAIRLVRVLRVFKFGRHSKGLHMFAGAISMSTQPLSVLGFTIVLAVIIVSSIIYLAEGELGNTNSTSFDDEIFSGGSDPAVHMRCYGTIPRTFWWAFVTMTTVGYGDCYPLTFIGKVVATATMFLGVLILALPITVIGSNFQKMVQDYEQDVAMLREFDTSEDGNIDIDELKAFISAKKKENALRRDVDLKPEGLMIKYDPQAKGVLSFAEFANLKADIIDPSASDMQSNVRMLLKKQQMQEVDIAEMREQLDRIERILLGGADPPIPSSRLIKQGKRAGGPPSPTTVAVDAESASASAA